MEIIYEDEQILVLNKPAGVVVNRSETVRGETIQDWLVKYLGKERMQGKLMKSRNGLAHRLDKETSGCLLIGKSEEVLERLLAAFKGREVEKEYLALVHGLVEVGEGGMSLPIERDRRDREKRRVGYQGKKAETWWKVEEYFEKNEEKLTLLRIWPKTGRTHQIRVHLAHIGHPIFSDSMYLAKKKREADREKLARHFLHACKLTFNHPVENRKVEVEAPLGEELEFLLTELRD